MKVYSNKFKISLQENHFTYKAAISITTKNKKSICDPYLSSFLLAPIPCQTYSLWRSWQTFFINFDTKKYCKMLVHKVNYSVIKFRECVDVLFILVPQFMITLQNNRVSNHSFLLTVSEEKYNLRINKFKDWTETDIYIKP